MLKTTKERGRNQNTAGKMTLNDLNDAQWTYKPTAMYYFRATK